MVEHDEVLHSLKEFVAAALLQSNPADASAVLKQAQGSIARWKCITSGISVALP